MKRSIVLFGCVFLLLGGGCQEHNRNKSGAEVIIEGGGEFPQSLVGRWKTNDYAWQFVFEPDGKISSIIFNMGEVEIFAGRTTTVPTISDGKAIFKPGLWTVQYDPKFRELTVEIVTDYIHFEMGSQLLEGKRTDTFTGKVSEDGKTWQTDWYSFPDYMAYATETKRLTVTLDESLVDTITFEKSEEQKQLPSSTEESK
jgi:hypothetical protein